MGIFANLTDQNEYFPTLSSAYRHTSTSRETYFLYTAVFLKHWAMDKVQKLRGSKRDGPNPMQPNWVYSVLVPEII